MITHIAYFVCYLVSGRRLLEPKIEFMVSAIRNENTGKFLDVFLTVHHELTIYEGGSICKLQIVIEKNRMEIMTYKQHLFFNIISIHI